MIQQSHANGIRPMQAADLPAVMEIEKQSYDFPWSEGIFRDCLANSYQSMLYVDQQQIQAYAVSQNIVDECHLLNLTVHPEARNQGIGKKMLRYLINQARRNDIGSLFLEVRVSNITAITLYEHLGFNEVGMRHDYYPASNGREDALVFAFEVV